MPVLVVGADTEIGVAAVEALLPRSAEVRAFVSDAAAGQEMKRRGAKVAVGDVSDASHIAGAGLNAFSAVLVAEAARDERPRAFAASPEEVAAAWAEGIAEAGVKRVIWVGEEEAPDALATTGIEHASVPTAGLSPAEVASAVAELDEAAELP